MIDFDNWIVSRELEESAFEGPWFSWKNKQEGNPIVRRIDRVLMNTSWLVHFHSFAVTLLPPRLSDHCGLLVNTDSQATSLPKPFKYFNCWETHPQYNQIIREAWGRSFKGTAMFIVCQKLREVKRQLRKLNRSAYSEISERVRLIRCELEDLQIEALQQPSPESFQGVNECQLRLNELLKEEETIYRQKSRLLWVKTGDMNTSYFHNYVKARQARSTIKQIISEEGTTLTDTREMSEEAVRFYQKLLGTKNADVQRVSSALLSQLLAHSLTPAQAAPLCSQVSREEVRAALFSMNGDKSPGPDGFTAGFFQHNWGILGKDLTDAVLDFFRTGKLLAEVNSTYLALIPKVQNADCMKQFRPISCCNILYKCIAKVLANRLREVLPIVISQNQSAFIKGRLISDNVLLAHEMVRLYNRKAISPRCALKVDVMKAFDSVDWGYLRTVMQAMKIADQFIKWIDICLQSTKLSVCFNGGLCGNFAAQKGLRQGDPLSPYMFVIAMEVLSCMFNRAYAIKTLPPHPQTHRISLSHLCFADDLLVFTKGTPEAVGQAKAILDTFYTVSGLKCNPAKSEVFCGGVSPSVQTLISSRTGFAIGHLPVRYLGIPLIAGKLNKVDCQALVDKITTRIRGWKVRTLSYAGKLQLISAVISSITQYWMGIIQLPAKVIKMVEMACSDFLWSSEEEGKRAKVIWSMVARPKKEGGLGFKDLRSWNMACLVRHLWAISSNSSSLWANWVRHYQTSYTSIWEIPDTIPCSWAWRKVLKIRTRVAQHLIVRSGRVFWKDHEMVKFSVKKVWETLRVQHDLVPWYALIWKSLGAPRDKLIVWLIALNRISTLDKVARWNSLVTNICPLCTNMAESRDHLFFECSYSQTVLKAVLAGQNLVRVSWEESLEAAVSLFRMQGPSSDRGKLIWVMVVAELWRERCRRAMAGEVLSENQLLVKLQRSLRLLRGGFPQIEIVVPEDFVNSIV
ncbi:unnamed protein product [Linum trigynum]|uniref:Reverse transcriptase domain-containing protein n=1 Tax=Linum trigynum TaxID=586398 RepID=A0AAV2CN25_9ROSI